MNILQKMQNKLREYPQIKFETFKSEVYENISVKALSNKGFPVSLFLYKNGEFQICGDDWIYEQVDLKDEEEAVEKFLLCLSNKARLRVVTRGGKSYCGIIEIDVNGKWKQDTASMNLPAFLSSFWKKKTEYIYQNTFIQQ